MIHLGNHGSPEQPSYGERREGIYSGKQMLITGSGGAIGYALTQEALSQGASQVLGIDKTVYNFPSLNAPASFVDITDFEALKTRAQDFYDYFKEKRIRLDCAIYAAGITQSKPGEVDLQERKTLWDVNVGGTRNSAAAFHRLLNPTGTVVFISSDLIRQEQNDLPAYTETKKEIVEIAKRYRQGFPNLRILVILPGPVRSKLFETGKTQEDIARIQEKVGIMTPRRFAQKLLREVLPDTKTYRPGAMVSVYERETKVVGRF